MMAERLPEEATIWGPYHEAFPDNPLPLLAWHGGAPELLAAVMEKAIRMGRPLTPNDLLKAQGIAPPPEPADV